MARKVFSALFRMLLGIGAVSIPFAVMLLLVFIISRNDTLLTAFMGFIIVASLAVMGGLAWIIGDGIIDKWKHK